MSDTPHVAVIIANHNYGRWVNGAILSAARQDYPNLSIVVSDDGSTDNSKEKILSLLSNAKEKKGFFLGEVEGRSLALIGGKSPKGPSAARNVAIKWAWDYSDLFAILDADDEFRPTKVRRCVECWLGDPGVIGVVYSDYSTIDENGVQIREYKEPFSRNRLFQQCIVHSAGVIAKGVFEAVGFQDEDLRCAEDYDLWLRASDRYMIAHVPEDLMLVRTHSQNSTNSVASETWQRCWARVREKTLQRMGRAA